MVTFRAVFLVNADHSYLREFTGFVDAAFIVCEQMVIKPRPSTKIAPNRRIHGEIVIR